MHGKNPLATICGHADENCPVLPARVRKEHWPLDDPAKVVGAEEAVMGAFRDGRDDIQLRVEEFIHRLSDGSRQERND